MELVNNDCLEYMKTLPDKSVDLFLCDLPYGCLSAKPLVIPNTENKHRKACPPTDRKGCNWDIKIDLTQFWLQVERLMKNDHTPIIHFCNTRFGYELMKSKEDWFRYDLVWNKQRGVSFLLANKQPMKSHENIYVFAKKGANYYRKDEIAEGKKAYNKPNDLKQNPNNIYGVTERLPRKQEDGKRCVLSVINEFSCPSSKTSGNHPTQKPLDLYKFLIERYSKEGDTVLDPTAGSFASGVAAKELNRNYIGIEMNKDFYEKGIKLLNK